jgi:hypothetical protein
MVHHTRGGRAARRVCEELGALTGIEPDTLQMWRDVHVLSLLFSDLAVQPMVRRGRYGAPTWLTGG